MEEKEKNNFIEFLLDNFNISKKISETENKNSLEDILEKIPDIKKGVKKDIEKDIVLNWKKISARNQKTVLREILKNANNINIKKDNYQYHPFLVNILTPGVVVFTLALYISLFTPTFSKNFVYITDELIKSSLKTISYKFAQVKAKDINKNDARSIQKNTITKEMMSDYVRKKRYDILEKKNENNIFKVNRDDLFGRVAGVSDKNESLINQASEQKLKKEQKRSKVLQFLYDLAEKQRNFTKEIDKKLTNLISK